MLASALPTTDEVSWVRRPKSALTPATTIARARVGKDKDAGSAPQLGRGAGSRRGGMARRGASRLQAAAAVIEVHNAAKDREMKTKDMRS